MTITTNIAAMKAANDLEATQNRLNQSLARLSSGSKIITAADDPAGLAASMTLNATAERTDAASSNVANALSFTQTQDGYLQGIATALTQMSQLAVEAQDQTKSDTDRGEYDAEFQQLSQYIQSTATKDFDGVSLFAGNNINVTLDADNSETLTMTPINLSGTTAYTAATSADISTTLGAIAAMSSVNAAIQQLSEDRATIGAWETRLNYAANQLTVTKENLTAASSQITDVDVANESTEYARENVMLQAGTAMLAQANQLPQTVLKLIS